MSAPLSIEIVCQPLERIAADLAVAGFFSDQRPMRGAASRADWRLCGLVSEMIMRGRITGRRGEAVLIPSLDRLYAPRVMLLGLGQRSKFNLRSARAVSREAVERALDLRIRCLAVPPLGIEADDLPRHVGMILEGALEALASEDRAGDGLRLRLSVPSAELGRVAGALEVAAEKLGVAKVALELPARSGAKAAS
jgi:hypothetical protein